MNIKVYIILLELLAVLCMITAIDVGAPITVPTRWTKASGPYVVKSTITVLSDLTIESGTEIRFDSGKGLLVEENGRLFATGTQTNPIVFTSNRVSPAAGDWIGIGFTGSKSASVVSSSGAYQQGSILSNCIVEFAGRNTMGSVSSYNSNIWIENSTIRYSSSSGVATDSKAFVSNSVISSCKNGVSAISKQPVEVSVKGTNITQCSSIGIYIDTEDTSGLSVLKLIGNSLEENLVDISLDGTALSIEINDNRLSGQLIHRMSLSSAGSSYFTSNTYSLVSSGSAVVYSAQQGAHTISKNTFHVSQVDKLFQFQVTGQTTTVKFMNNTITSIDASELIQVQVSSGLFQFENNQISNNTYSKSILSFSGSGSSVVQFNLFTDNLPTADEASTIISSTRTVTITRNIFIAYQVTIHIKFTMSTEFFLTATENYFGAYAESNATVTSYLYDFFTDATLGFIEYSPFLSGQSFTSELIFDDSINKIENGTHVWSSEMGEVIVNKILFIAENATLIIEPGVTIRMGTNSSIINSGSLICSGNASHPIIFTRLNTAGGWNSIIFTSNAVEGTQLSPMFEYTVFEYGGTRNAQGVLYLGAKYIYLYSITIRYSYSAAVYSKKGMILRRSTFEQNEGTHVVIKSSVNSDTLIEENIFLQSSQCACDVSASGSNMVFSSNTLSQNECGGKLAYGSSNLMLIESNIVRDNVASGLDMYISGNSNIRNNTISGSSEKALYLQVNSGIVYYEHNNVWYNFVSQRVTHFYMNSNCRQYSELTIRNNTFTMNRSPYTIIRIDSIDKISCKGLSMVYFEYNQFTDNVVEGGSAMEVTGALAEITNNIISNQAEKEIAYYGSVVGLDLNTAGNWWGTNNTQEIQSKVYDVLNNANYGKVNFSPYLSGPSLSSETIQKEINPLVEIVSREVVIDQSTVVSEDIIVEIDATLILMSGVELTMAYGASIIVKGKLVVLGLPGAEVTITSQSGWGTILFTETAQETETDTEGNYSHGSVLSNVILRGGGVNTLGSIVLRSNIHMTNVTIESSQSYGIYSRSGFVLRDSSISNCQKGGLYISDTTASTMVIVAKTSFETINSGWAIYMQVKSSATSSILVQDNSILSCSKGIYVDVVGKFLEISKNVVQEIADSGIRCIGSVDNIEDSSFAIEDNTVTRVASGCSLCLNSTSSDTNIYVTGNTVTNNVGDNVAVIDVDGCSSFSRTISGNTFAENSANLNVVVLVSSMCYTTKQDYFTRNVITDNQLATDETIPLTIIGDQLIAKRNIIDNEGQYEVRNGNELTNYLDIRENYLGSDYANDVKHSLYDTYVSFLSGRFIYAPFLTNASFDSPMRNENCSYGYVGGNCEFFDCISTLNNCTGNGECVAPFTCQCNEGWSEEKCDVFNCNKVGNCSMHGTCVGPNQCTCESGWKGDSCSEVDCSSLNYCSNHGTCTGPNDCTCNSGWHLDDCSLTYCSGVASSNSTVCSGIGTNGWCTNPDSCTCTSSWTGTNCENPICYGKASTSSSVCSGHGTCNAPNSCSCAEGYTGPNCQYPVCYGISGNSKSACSTNGTCTAPDNCSCGSYLGNTCEYYQCFGTNSTETSVCNGRGSCISPDRCACNYGYAGDRCQYYTCFSISEVEPVVCSAKGMCQNVDYCNCTQGYAGSNCESPICFGIYGDSACSDGQGTCTSPDKCSCVPGFGGNECQYHTCGGKTSIDPSVCSGRGNCTDSDYCECEPGYTGQNCEQSICFGTASNTLGVCTGKGTCSSPDNCVCNEGYFGDKCQYTYCNGIQSNDTSVCSSRGRCYDYNYCVCDYGYGGVGCNLNICFERSEIHPDVCSGVGNCTAPNTCVCKDGYTGMNCEYLRCFSQNTMTSLVCSGNGQCTSVDKCTCNSGYTGKECEYPICFNKSSNDTAVCSGRGTCTAPNTCKCTQSNLFGGNNCQYYKCYGKLQTSTSVCSGHGLCGAYPTPGTCLCNTGYTGYQCDISMCYGINGTSSSVCSGRGSCTAPDTCVCTNEDYTGSDCSQIKPMSLVASAGWTLQFLGMEYSASEETTKFSYSLSILSTERAVANLTLGFIEDRDYTFVTNMLANVFGVDSASSINGLIISGNFAPGTVTTFNIVLEGEYDVKMIDYSISGGRKYIVGTIFGPGEAILPPVLSISGVVFFDENANSAKDTTEVDLYSVHVQLFEANTGTLVQTQITTSAGYSFNNLPLGRYIVKLDTTKGLLATVAGMRITNKDIIFPVELKKTNLVVNFPLRSPPARVIDTCEQCGAFLDSIGL